MFARLLQLLGLRHRRRGERIVTSVEGDELLTPWGRWLDAEPGRQLAVFDASEAGDHQALIDSHLSKLAPRRALLVLDPISYSFVRDAPPQSHLEESILVTFGTRADVVERTGGKIELDVTEQQLAALDPAPDPALDPALDPFHLPAPLADIPQVPHAQE